MAGTGTEHLRPRDETILRVEDLVVEFPAGSRRSGLKVHAVSGISLDIKEGETLGLVGESGCGKSTTGKAIMQLPRPKAGTVEFEGTDLTGLSGTSLREIRARMQMIFQDPISSLNPRRKVEDVIAEGLRIWKVGSDEERAAKVREMMVTVGLDPEVHSGRRPYEFSGGQCQRISIARAVANDPKLIICDEPVSALDVSVQAQILNLLRSLQKEFDLTYVFISHDLSVMRQICTRIAVMYLGRIVELADAEEIFENP